MRGKFVTIISRGETKTHMADTLIGSYATLCGLDGGDEDAAVDQRTIRSNACKVDCKACISIYDLCKSYMESDITR